MTITAHSPKWANAEHTSIDLMVQFPWITGEVPFTAVPNDIDYTAELFNGAIAGDFGTIEEFIAPPTPIYAVSPKQIRQALTRLNLRQQVEDAVVAGDQDLKDWWEFSTIYERNNVEVKSLGAAIAVSDKQLDDLWLLAATV